MNSDYVCSNCRYESAFYLSECPRCWRDASFAEVRTYEATGQPIAQAFAPPASSPHAAASDGAVVVAAAGKRELRVCHNYWCTYKTREPLGQCPKCGQALRTTQDMRALGVVLAILGALITTAMLAAIGGLAYLISQMGKPGWPPRLNGGPTHLVVAFGILGLVAAIGASFTVAGIWQFVYGKRNNTVIFVGFVLVLVVVFIGEVILSLF